MTARRTPAEAEVVDMLMTLAIAHVGFRRDAILPDAMRKLVRSRGASLELLQSQAATADPALIAAITAAVSVGETFFFRGASDFERIGALFAGKPVRAWSAGCATGEETWSLAATLLAASPDAAVSVLGTDMVPSNIGVAEAGEYARWSIRETSPLLFPVFEPHESGHRVRRELRRVTRFATHNLLDPPPAGPFDLIVCRNVTVYFTPDAVRRVCEHLVSALAPEGVLVFAAVDPVELPAGFERVSRSEVQAWTRVVAAARDASPKPQRPPEVAPPLPPAVVKTDPVELHVRALEHVERGEQPSAAAVLLVLRRTHPEYLPAILELAVLRIRESAAREALELMREVLARTDGLADDTPIRGPESLPVEYYRATARAYIGRVGRGEKP